MKTLVELRVTAKAKRGGDNSAMASASSPESPALPPAPTSPADPELDIDATAHRGSRGIQSVEVGGQLLKALAHTGRRMALKDLARDAGMTAAKAHPYLVSFGKLGLIEQDPASGHYGLGPLALQLGLISLQQADPIRLAMEALPDLALRVGATVGIAVWGTRGPTVIAVEEGPTDVHVAMRHGTNASVRHTASGKVFAAHLPHDKVAAALAADGDANALEDPAFVAELAQIRDQQVSVVRDQLVPGIAAVAVPVFDGLGRLALCFTAIGPSATLDPQPGGACARTLQETARQLSSKLGARAK